jgi:hypothetical protein
MSDIFDPGEAMAAGYEPTFFVNKEVAEKDAEIERLKALVREHSCEAAELAWFKKDALKLISELADALEEDEDFIEHQFEFSKEKIKNKFRPLIQRAKEIKPLGNRDKLIGELADALENFKGYGVHLTREEADLIRRAREAIK